MTHYPVQRIVFISVHCVMNTACSNGLQIRKSTVKPVTDSLCLLRTYLFFKTNTLKKSQNKRSMDTKKFFQKKTANPCEEVTFIQMSVSLYLRLNHSVQPATQPRCTIRTVHTTHAAALKTTTHPKAPCKKPYAANQRLMLLMMDVSTRNMSS